MTLLKQHASVTKQMHKLLKIAEKQRSREKKFTVALVNGLDLGGAENSHQGLEIE